MFLCNNIDDISFNNIFCYDKMKNNIMENSFFYKLVYSDSESCFNGIFFMINLKNCFVEKYFDKLKITLSECKENRDIGFKVQNFEENIFKKFKTKFTNYNLEKRLSQQLNQMILKIQNNNFKNCNTYQDVKVIIKISGMWENSKTKQIGLTFKYFLANRTI